MHMKSLALIVALFFCASAFGALPGVTEFKTTPEKITDAELSALLHARVASADVIAIGETVHGSSAFLKIQARLIRYLVTSHGLRLIAWENPTVRSLEFAQWVSSCTKAKSPAPIDVFYMPTAADLPLWEWVCAFNLAHPDNPIIFRGMDIWDRPWEHYARIRTLSAKVGVQSNLIKNMESSCPAVQSMSWPQIDIVLAQQQPDGKVFPEAAYEKCRAALTALLDTTRQSGLEKKQKKEADSDDAFELAISASTLLGWLGFYHHERSDDILSWNERDRAQGRNLMLVMEKHGAARAILSAHSSHVSHNRSPADWWGYGDLKSGVYFLTAMTGKKVFNIAFTAYRAASPQGEWSLPVAPNSLDKKLRDAGHAFSYFAVDAAFLSQHTKWWIQNQNFPGRYQSGVEIIPRDHFDAFVFFEHSPLEKTLPARPMWQP